MRLQTCLMHLVFIGDNVLPWYHSHENSIGYMIRSFDLIFSYTETDVTTIHPSYAENDITTIHPSICYGKTS